MRKAFSLMVLLVLCTRIVSVTAAPVVQKHPQSVDDRGTLPSFMRHFYIGAEAGYSYPDYTSAQFPNALPPTSTDNGGLGAHPFAGYRFNRYFAAEMDVFYFKRPVINGTPRANDATSLHHNVVGWYAAGFYPLSRRWQAIAKAGLGYVARSSIVNGSQIVLPEGLFFSPLVSVGLAFEFYPQWFLQVSANYAFANNTYQVPLSQFYGAGIFYSLGKAYD